MFSRWILAVLALANYGLAEQTYDVIVVGLGSSGVTAATTLAKAGKKVLGLEAMDRIGGRVKTVSFDGGIAEEGAEWIHGTVNSRVYDLAVENNITVLPQDFEFLIFRSDGDESFHQVYLELFNLCMEKSMSAPDPSYVSIGDYLTAEILNYLKEKHPGLQKNKAFVEEFMNVMNLFVNAYEASNDWHDVSTQSKSEELDGHLHMSWHKHGYKTFFELMLNTYKGGPGLPNLEIKLSTEVSRVEWSEDGGEVSVLCADGARYTAQHVIVTVSVGVLQERHETLFSPALPHDKISAINRITIGVVDKVILYWLEPWCPKVDFKLIWSQCDAEALSDDDQWLWKVSEVTSSMVSDKTLTLWVIGDTAKYSTLFSPELPQDKITSIQKISLGIVDKVVLNFPHNWWGGSSVFVLIEGDPTEDRWFTKHGDISTTMAKDTALTFWLAGDIAKTTETLPDDVVLRKSMQLLRRFLGRNYTIPEATGMIRSKWYSNPYTRGSYSFDNLETPKYPDARKILGRPLVDESGVPRVLFAGEATNEIHYATVHGASETGYREAMRILNLK